MEPTDRLVDISTVADTLAVSRRSAYRLIEDGILPGVRLRERVLRVRLSDLERFVTDGAGEKA